MVSEPCQKIAEYLGYSNPSGDSIPQVVLHKWLMDLHGVIVTPIVVKPLGSGVSFSVCIHSSQDEVHCKEVFNSWGEALNKGIMEALITIKLGVESDFEV